MGWASKHRKEMKLKLSCVLDSSPICLTNTADNLSNAKPVVQQRHPVSQRGSAKGKQSVPVPILMMDIYLYRK